MDLKTAISRAKRGLREDLRLYLVAISSLTVAFLCLGATLLSVVNLSELASQWGRSRRMTVYLVDGARPRDVLQLRTLLEELPEVRSAEHVSASQARAQFLEQADLAGELGELPPDVFPSSVEVTLTGDVPIQRVTEIAQRLQRFGTVDEVETYGGWFGKLENLLTAGQSISALLAVLVLVCVLAVVGNTIRLAVAGRRQEIEVMKLCGATDSFVRRPFVVEGAFQGFMAALASLVLLLVGFLIVKGQLDSTVTVVTGLHAVFLSPLVIAAMLVGGCLAGAAGSALSLRRYLTV